MKVHGIIVLDEDGKPLVGPYGQVLLFSKSEDAELVKPDGGRLVAAIRGKVDKRDRPKAAKQ